MEARFTARCPSEPQRGNFARWSVLRQTQCVTLYFEGLFVNLHLMMMMIVMMTVEGIWRAAQDFQPSCAIC